MKKKTGIITQVDIAESRAIAVELSAQVQNIHRQMIPHRIDHNTVILIKSDEDKEKQLKRFSSKLEKSRMNY